MNDKQRIAKHMRFDPKLWENQGQGKKLIGQRIKVLQYNQGKNANFYLEAWGDSYACLRGETPAPSVGKTISGKGPDARDTAIKAALALAETGLYRI